MAEQKEKRKRILWNTDGVKDGPSSLQNLLDWLTVEGNYNKYKGGDEHSGIGKKCYAAVIINEMNGKGIIHRKVNDVITKIDNLEKEFKEASDWLANTGQGVTDENNLREAVLKRCAHYYELEPVMADRASTRPLLTNEGSDDSNDEEEKDTDTSPPSSVFSSASKAKGKRSFLQIIEEDKARVIAATNMIEQKKIKIEENRFQLEKKRFELAEKQEMIKVRIEILRARKTAVEELRIEKEEAELLFPLE
jgi:hypothetical protein